MGFRFALMAGFFPLCLSIVHALDVSGVVLDKMEKPIANPKICILADSTECVMGDAVGAFHFVKANPIKKLPPAIRLGLEFHGGMFWLRSATTSPVEVAWFDSRGQNLETRRMVVTPGENPLGVESNLRDGLYLVRVRAGGAVLIGKVLVAGKSRGMGLPTIIAPTGLAKTTHHEERTLVISKAGYRDGYESFLYYADSMKTKVFHLAKSDDSGFFLTQKFSAVVKTLDRAQRKLVFESSYKGCQGDTLVKKTSVSSWNYAYRDGAMLTWSDSSCDAGRLTGAGPDITGSWTRDAHSVHLPPDLQVPNCQSAIQFREYTTSKVRISDTEIVMETDYEVCPDEWYIYYNLEEFFGTNNNVTRISGRCLQSTYQNAKKETAVFSSRLSGRIITIDYQFGGASCRYLKEPIPSELTACPDPQDIAYDDFVKCIKQSGFAITP